MGQGVCCADRNAASISAQTEAIDPPVPVNAGSDGGRPALTDTPEPKTLAELKSSPPGVRELKILFQVPGCDEERLAVFVRRPLGLDFDKKAPITMKRVQTGGHGAELGVKPGWVVKAVNGENVDG